MGGLHPGHQYLIQKAKEKEAKTHHIILVSIFVNPLQFSKSEDFKKYPRNKNKDAELALIAGADALRLIDIARKHGISGVGISQRGTHAKRFIHIDTLSDDKHPRPTMWSY